VQADREEAARLAAESGQEPEGPNTQRITRSRGAGARVAEDAGGGQGGLGEQGVRGGGRGRAGQRGRGT
jgi:hypothetical protein